MARTKDLLKKQEINFDNHHEGVPAEWNDSLHFHKKMTVKSPEGVKTEISAILHVAKERGIKATYNRGKSHPKIKDAKEREFYENKIKKEINDAIVANEEEARPFLRTIMKEIESISKGETQSEIIKRKQEAYDNIMGALGISPKLKVSLKNKNNDLLSLYVQAPSSNEALDGLLYLSTMYGKSYQYIETPGSEVYYIAYVADRFTMGELTPYAYLKYKYQGFNLNKSGIIDILLIIIDKKKR